MQCFLYYITGWDWQRTCSSAHESLSFITTGAWATAMRCSCLHAGFGVLPVLFPSRTMWSPCLVHLPFHDPVSLVLLSFLPEGFWVGDNSSSILDTPAGCQKCWLLGAGPGSSWSQILLLLWLCCRAWEIQSRECYHYTKYFHFIGSPMISYRPRLQWWYYIF